MRFGPDTFWQPPFTCWLDFVVVGTSLLVEYLF